MIYQNWMNIKRIWFKFMKEYNKGTFISSVIYDKLGVDITVAKSIDKYGNH